MHLLWEYMVMIIKRFDIWYDVFCKATWVGLALLVIAMMICITLEVKSWQP